jgi:hypothetical protein
MNKKDRRIERITSLVTADEMRRINAFCRAQGLAKSDMIRHTVLSTVEVWENDTAHA